MNKLILANGRSRKEIPVGFSWTSALFGPIVPLLRMDYAAFAVSLICSFITCGFSSIIQAFIYNCSHARRLIEGGYSVVEFPEKWNDAKLESYLAVTSVPYYINEK